MLLVVACGDEPPSQRADRSAYFRALAAEDPEACLPIEAADLRHECVALTSSALAETDLVTAQLWCARVPPGVWRDECAFLSCDTAAVPLASARSCCSSAGRYATRCLGHAVSRAITAELSTHAPGDEASAWEAARSIAVGALGPSGEARALEFVAQAWSSRMGEDGLTDAVCGTAPAVVCAAVYEAAIGALASEAGVTPKERVRPACARVVRPSRAGSAGLPLWQPSQDAVVQGVFKRLCAR